MVPVDRAVEAGRLNLDVRKAQQNQISKQFKRVLGKPQKSTAGRPASNAFSEFSRYAGSEDEED